MKTFVLNDENVKNCYGFFVRNSGGNFDRFKTNPVMLHNHDQNQHTGRWANFRVEDPLILAEPDFMDSVCANEVKKAVENDYLKGASMGLLIDSNTAFERQPNGDWWCVKWELSEASTCPVPANAGAISLFDVHTRKELKSEQIALCLSKLEQDFKTKSNNPTMEKFEFSVPTLVALGLNNQPQNAQEVDLHVQKLATKLKDEQDAHAETKKQLSAIAEGPAKELVKQAKLSGKITDSEVPEWEKMAKENYALASSALAKIPAKTNLSNGIRVPEGDGTQDDLPKNQDEFEKLSLDAQLAFKKDHPEAYKALWK